MHTETPEIENRTEKNVSQVVKRLFGLVNVSVWTSGDKPSASNVAVDLGQAYTGQANSLLS